MRDKIEELMKKYSQELGDFDFGSEQNLLPIAMKVAAQTIGKDLVSAQPLPNPGISNEKLDEIKREVKRENRDRKIDSIVDGEEFKEMKLEDHPEFSPVSNLFYLDYQYTSPIKPIKGNP